MVQFVVTDRVIDTKTFKLLPRGNDKPGSAAQSGALPSQSPDPGSRGDSVALSDDAKAMMEPSKAAARGQFTLTTDELTTRVRGFDPRTFTPAYREAEQAYREQTRAYDDERGTLLEEKFGVKVSLIGGAGFGVLDRLAAQHGIRKPDVPAAMLDAGWSDPFEQDKDSPAGVLGIGVPGTDRSVTIAFDRTVSIPPETPLTLAALTQAGADAGTLPGVVRTGALGKFTDWDLTAAKGVHAVTDGTKGPNAKVLATISSNAMDGETRSRALSLLSALKDVMKAP
ncbi:hypothetical protein [Azospirillum doebereinerae]